MPTGMQTSSGTANSQSSQAQSDAGWMSKMKNFFNSNEGQQANPTGDPWAAEEAQAAQESEANKPKELSAYGDLFKTKEPADKKTQRDDPFAAVNKENLESAAKNMDFSANVDDATMTAALGGDATAMRAAINQAARAAFSESMSASNTLMQKRINDTVETRVSELISTKFKDFEIQKEVSSNPLLSAPATKPMRDMLTQNIKKANPDFSAKQINQELTGYLQAFANSVNAETPKAGKTNRVGKAIESASDF